MPKEQKRDYVSYYVPRLQTEHPIIYADLLAGKYRSVRAALAAADLKKPPRALTSLRNAWKKASPADRAAFLREISATIAASAPSKATPIAIDQRLTPETKERIKSIMISRRLSMGALMDELGASRLNPVIGLALSRDFRVSLDMISALERWLTKHP